MTRPNMLNMPPASQTCSYHVLFYRGSHHRRSALWKYSHATSVIRDYTFVHIQIQLLWPRLEGMVSEGCLFSTLLCLILTCLVGWMDPEPVQTTLDSLDVIPSSSTGSQTCSPGQSLTHCWQQKRSKNIPAAISSCFLSSALKECYLVAWTWKCLHSQSGSGWDSLCGFRKPLSEKR